MKNTTPENQEFISSDKTDSSKPWTAVVKLGERIVRELGLDDDVDTLGRWMAHRFAELAERAENAESEERREVLRRECIDLVFKLWERRSRETYRQPLTGIATFLKKIRGKGDTSRSVLIVGYKNAVTVNSWVEILPHLQDIADREWLVCYYAALAELDLTAESELLAENSDALPDEEREMIENLIETRKQLESEHFRLDEISAPRFATLSQAERSRLVNEALEKLAAARKGLFESVNSAGKSQTRKKATTTQKPAKEARARKKKA